MAFQGFGRNSGPSAPPKAQNPFGHFPRPPSPIQALPDSTFARSPREFEAPGKMHSPPFAFESNRSVVGPSYPSAGVNRPIDSSPRWGDAQNILEQDYNAQSHQRPSAILPFVALHDSATGHPAKSAPAQDLKRTRSPLLPSLNEDHLRNSRTVIGRHDPSYTVWGNQSKVSSNFANQRTLQDLSSASPFFDTYDSGRNFPTKHEDPQVPKQTTSPPLQSTSETSWENSLFVRNDSRRPSISPPRLRTRSNVHFGIQDSQSHQRSIPFEHVDAEAATTKTASVQLPKRTRSPSLPSSDQILQGNSFSLEDDSERELQAKAKRLARFKDELSQPMQSSLGIVKQKVPAERYDQSMGERQKFIGEPSDVVGVFPNGNVSSDYEGMETSTIIVGFCPDMCPESERAERERKGDLDQYERLDGDRNKTSKSLAVKKYTRTAEREASLIRPMSILQKTMDYLLNLLDQPYNDRFLSLYNFLWDRMRAIRMDLRMQHIFNLEAITMLEKMIRLHIIAMHELCEYTKGEGFSEGFDAHLNIEQMNKTSVELFQLYDDHRKKGIDVPTEKEFRGYYALLKLDKHPGYKVEPAELSLDLAKMTREIRQTPEVLFARDVARACRTSNFIAFFRLSRKASYLQSCLMHAHFAKLRTQALTSLHSGLQNNQGIPVSHVAKWLGMEEEDTENLLEYHGFVIKEFEEPYMVKEGSFLNGDDDYPVKCSKLVHLKKTRRIVEDVSSPCLVKSSSSAKLKELKVAKVYKQETTPVQFVQTEISARTSDEEMPDYETVLSRQDDMQVKPMLKTLLVDRRKADDHQMVALGPLPWDFSSAHSSSEDQLARVRSPRNVSYDTPFRNSLETNTYSDMKATPLQIMPRRVEQERLQVLKIDSATENSVPESVFVQDFEDDEHTDIHQEVETDEVETSCHDEVAKAKLKLILRIWRRCSEKKRKLRERKQLAANAALSSLSLGPPIQHYKDKPSTFIEFNVDRVMTERHKKHEQSWSTLNVSEVIAAKLSSRNPDAKCLCWKIILCSQMDNPDGDKLEQRSQVARLSAGRWLLSKVIPSRESNGDDLIISCPGLSIWKKWIPGQSDGNMTCCLSVVKDTKFDNVDDGVAGASAALFLVSECISWELQKIRLHNLLMSLTSGSCLPLLILSDSYTDNSDTSTIVEKLGLLDFDRSRTSAFSVVSLVKNQQMKHLGGFFSDEELRKGLRWLASESPLQPILSRVKTREVVLSHLNSSLEAVDKSKAYRVGPDHCISAFNEALDRSVEEIATAANANPTRWPCPEIALLEESSYEHRALCSYLPMTGWSSAATTKPLICVLSDCKLPGFPDDTSWLYRGSDLGYDIENQRLQLESCLIRYFTQSTRMMDLSLATKEASVMLQRCSQLELHNSTYYIVPNWVMIFRRVFNWRLTSLSDEALSTAYVLDRYNVAISISSDLDKLEVEDSTPYYLVHPSLDEMVEVGCSSLVSMTSYSENVAYPPPLSEMVSNGSEVQKVIERSESMEDQRNYAWDDHITNELKNGSTTVVGTKATTKEADRLSNLLEKCNIVQKMIDEKLSIYF